MNKHTLLRLVQIVLATTVVMGIAIGREFTSDARRAVFGQREIQIYIPYSGALPIDLPPVLLVAHNAGDQYSTTKKALDHNAAGIEIDVSWVGEELYAAHNGPPEVVPLQVWRAPRLKTAWNYADRAEVIKLDLKSTSWSALESLIRFITENPTEKQIIFVSSDVEALSYLHTALPQTLPFLSLSTATELDQLLETAGRIEAVDGISIPQWLLSEDRIQRMDDHGYLIDAWTVNDVTRLIELATFGVDVITTDNLAFFDMAVESAADLDTMPPSRTR